MFVLICLLLLTIIFVADCVCRIKDGVEFKDWLFMAINTALLFLLFIRVLSIISKTVGT